MEERRKVDDPFLYYAPVLDLHGETYESSRVLTKIFIEDNVKMKEKTLVIIHGIGKGIVKKAVHDELKINRYVKDFKTHNYNDGMTVVNIKENLLK